MTPRAATAAPVCSESQLASGVPQAEVATSVGFYDHSLLHRHFKRIVRVTPRRVGF